MTELAYAKSRVRQRVSVLPSGSADALIGRASLQTGVLAARIMCKVCLAVSLTLQKIVFTKKTIKKTI